MPLAINIRDRLARLLTAQMEPQREALREITRTRSLPLNKRMRAQVALDKMSRYTRPATLSNRCVASGRSRAIVLPQKLSPVEFRAQALKGELPGVSLRMF